MTNKYKIAIVGRPNVGKSALFNRLCGKRIAIVDEAEGVTRDRLYASAELFGREFEIIDTGGIDPRSEALFNEEIRRQAEIAIEEADSLIMVVDAQVGITALDKEVSKLLLRTEKPLCLAVNKIDDQHQSQRLHEFYGLGIEKMVGISATHGFQIAELLEAATVRLPEEDEVSEEEDRLKIAILGRPNVGKSTLLNALLDEDRCCVSDIPGTTRDSVDVHIEVEGKKFTLIDTAGIRRKTAEHDVIEKFAAIRTQRAIERADVCLLILDSMLGMEAQDKKIANMIEEAGKGCIILFNKWDLSHGFRMEHCQRDVEENVPFLKHCPKIFISAKSGRNLDKIFTQVEEVAKYLEYRVTTHQLNKFLEASMQKNHPAMIGGKRLRIYYMAQVGVKPPMFVFFVNYPNLLTDTYKKYLYNQFREEYSFTGCPLVMNIKKRSQRERPDG